MSRTRWLHALSDGTSHPDESLLLAYLRGQAGEKQASIRQHLEHDQCSLCLQQLHELEQITSVLDGLATMHAQQSYPEITVAATYARIEDLAQQHVSATTATRQGKYPARPGQSALRLNSVPFGVGLALLFTAMLVFAGFSGRMLNPFSSHGHRSSDPKALTVVVNPYSVPKQPSNPTATRVVSPGATPVAKGPYIRVCSTRANIVQLQLVICGFSFDSRHKAMIIVYAPGKVPFWLRNIPVDKQGKFQVEWNVTNCGNMPANIYGFETSGSKQIRAILHITSFGMCVAPQTPAANPPRHPPKFGF